MNLNSNEILQGKLWIGESIHPKEVNMLARSYITTVFNLQTDKDMADYGISLKALLAAYQEAGIELRRFPIPDFDLHSLAANLPPCVAELEEALHPTWSRVYMHCSAGINRAPTVAAAYLIRHRSMSAQQAYDFVISMRDCSPYLDILEKYSHSIFNSRAHP
jgi:protein-tyrosine phosphatase